MVGLLADGVRCLLSQARCLAGTASRRAGVMAAGPIGPAVCGAGQWPGTRNGAAYGLHAAAASFRPCDCRAGRGAAGCDRSRRGVVPADRRALFWGGGGRLRASCFRTLRRPVSGRAFARPGGIRPCYGRAGLLSGKGSGQGGTVACGGGAWVRLVRKYGWYGGLAQGYGWCGSTAGTGDWRRGTAGAEVRLVRGIGAGVRLVQENGWRRRKRERTADIEET